MGNKYKIVNRWNGATVAEGEADGNTIKGIVPNVPLCDSLLFVRDKVYVWTKPVVDTNPYEKLATDDQTTGKIITTFIFVDIDNAAMRAANEIYRRSKDVGELEYGMAIYQNKTEGTYCVTRMRQGMLNEVKMDSILDNKEEDYVFKAHVHSHPINLAYEYVNEFSVHDYYESLGGENSMPPIPLYLVCQPARWATGLKYEKDKTVIYGQQFWCAVVGHKSNDNNKPGVSNTHWKQTNAWSVGHAYIEDQVVSYEGLFWRAVVAHKSDQGNKPETSGCPWVEYSGTLIKFTPPPIRTDSVEYQAYKKKLKDLDTKSLPWKVRLQRSPDKSEVLRKLRIEKVNIVSEMLNQGGLLQKTSIAPVIDGLTYITWKKWDPQVVLGEGFLIY
jgi:hypothetical protein